LAGVTFPPEEKTSTASFADLLDERKRAEITAIDQAIGRAIAIRGCAAVFGERDSVHIVDTTSERWKSSSRLGRRPRDSSLLEGPLTALNERFRNELGGVK
jgi:hypothetical protein